MAILMVAVMPPALVHAQSSCPPLGAAGPHDALGNPAEPGSHNAKRDVNPISCRFDAELTRKFTPRTVPKDTYRVYVTDAGMDKVVAAFRAVASSPNAEGAWVVQEMDPLDAYGDAGLYDRAKVARLYLGVRARVARGPMTEQGRTVASITLVSPYPDASLTRLRQGTLIIEFKISSE